MARILVVDDEELNRDMLSRRLTKKGYEVTLAESGAEALRQVDDQDFDLVLLDIRMPGMDGNEVLEALRKTYSPLQLPVIMVTAEVDSSTMVKSLGLGADDYVTKPIDMPVLVARMENKLRVSQSVQEKLSSVSDSSSPSEQQIHAMIDSGESQNVEFKSTLRFNIRSGKIGKEITFAWLKTVVAFLNSDGGTLLVGVDDEGQLLGTELDDFKNDDKYLLHVNNAIKTNVGMEYISHIDFDLIDCGDKKVLWVQCQPFEEPVFLKNGNDEEFYTRFGPASRKLTMKEMLAYLKNRRK